MSNQHCVPVQERQSRLCATLLPTGANATRAAPLPPCPKHPPTYKPAPSHSCFLRTYSARIYFIGTNSSLACLHMPHPSNPVDDNSVHPYNREHGLHSLQVSRTFGSYFCVGRKTVRNTCQRVGRQSDGLPQGCSLLCSLYQYICFEQPSIV